MAATPLSHPPLSLVDIVNDDCSKWKRTKQAFVSTVSLMSCID